MDYDPIKILSELVACKSLTPDTDGVLEVLDNYLKPMQFSSKTLVFGEKNEKVDNLFLSLGSGSPHFCFAGHTDVVPSGNQSLWKFPPFNPTVHEKIFYGRGTVDMKGSIACFISSVDKFLNNFKNFKGRISFLITNDEEGPAINGTKKVIEWLNETGNVPDFCIVGEPTNSESIGDTIKIGRRGSLSGEIKVSGKQGHVAYPHLAENPFPILFKLLDPLIKFELDEQTQFFPKSTASITSVDTNNSANNVIPETVTAKFNIRFNDSLSREKLESFLINHFDSVSKNYEVKFTSNAYPFITKPDKQLDSLTKAIEYVSNIIPEFSTSGGTSDARFISKYCPVVEFGLVGKNMHQVDESSKISDIYLLKDIYYEFLKNYFILNK